MAEPMNESEEKDDPIELLIHCLEALSNSPYTEQSREYLQKWQIKQKEKEKQDGTTNE